MRYLKTFGNHNNYEDFIETEAFVKPNVSYCIQENEVHYNPWTDPRLIVKYNVTDASEPIKLYNYVIGKEGKIIATGAMMFDKIEIDDGDVSITAIDTAQGTYQFATAGEHTVKYTLKDPTSVVKGAFYNCTDLTSVTILNSVATIGDCAFMECSGLTSVIIPNSVTSIGNQAFDSCSSLTSVTIPNSVTSIGNVAFYGCSGLTSIKVESGNTTYDSRNDCNAIIETASNTLVVGCKNTVIPNTVTSIGDYAFQECTSLTSITIPNSVTSIGGSAFFHCSSLTSITIGNSVTSIGELAFYYCKSLTSIVSLATTAPIIKNDTFYGVKTNGILTVPSGSTGYDVWMGTGDYYLGKYSWTKVEQ